MKEPVGVHNEEISYLEEFGCIFHTRAAGRGAIFILLVVRITCQREKVRNMPNKQCCRGCGAMMSPVSECPVCKENTSWICSRCDTTADVTHTHSREITAFHSRVLQELRQRSE